LIAARPRWHQVEAVVRRQLPYGGGHFWLDLDVPRGLVTPRPGQFAQLLLPAALNPALLPRPMSVAGVRRVRGALTLGFLYAPVGAGTHALARLEPGERVELLGPLGHGFPLERPGTPILLAGGRGVAPLLFAAAELGRAGRRAEFLFGARDREHLVGLADARHTLERLGGRLRVCTDDGSRGARGHVVGLLDRVAPRLESKPVLHACGPHAMLKAAARWAIDHDCEAWLAMESVMACGTGVCRGCPLPRSESGRRAFPGAAPSLLGNRDYAMCCTEGPVFEARSLDWERIH
jgi:dihydroorotate dehydrogenase electron transfer subunit